ncbi:MAG TPA: DNA polymerase I [Treponemataceae bacterium]|nr:DNA polymerase I [Treponemataceae bacterium]
MSDTSTLFLLDSYGLIYRSYFAFINRPLINERGENVSAIFGFFRNFYNILRDYNPRYVVAAFDSQTPTFRHDIYKEYKANRDKTPEDLHAQVPIIENILNTLGIPVIRKDGFEADDIIATISKKAARKVHILSGDKDLMQLVNDTITMLKPNKSGGWLLVDQNAVGEEWGIPTKYLLDMLSLQGDAADNIPGVKGVGKKTAQKLINKYGNLDAIYEHADEIQGAMGNKIRAGKENAYFSKALVTLRYDVPIKTDCSLFQIKPNVLAAADLLHKAGVPSIAKLFTNGTTDKSDESKETKPITQKTISKQQDNILHLPRWAVEPEILEIKKNPAYDTYKLVQDISELSSFIQKAIKKGICALDTETDSLNALQSNLAGFSLSIAAETGIYVPIQVTDSLLSGNLINKADALTQLALLFGNSNMKIIMHNGKYDLKVLHTHGLWNHIVTHTHPAQMTLGQNDNKTFFSIQAKIIDTMIAAWLLQPDRNKFGLESLCETKLGLAGMSFKDTVPKGKTFMDLPLEHAVKYAAEDADFTFQLWQYYKPRLQQAKLDTLFYELEMPVLPILTKMELEGIQIVPTELEDYSDELTEEIEQIEKDIYEEVGHEFNIASPKQLQTVLFEERGLKPSKKTKTGYSTDTSVLENLVVYDIIPQMILEYRGKAKLKSTYVDTLPVLADTNNKIHTSYVQTGAATGRLSSREPNLQNIPIRDKAGRRIRTAFTATKGRTLVSADYSQIELVLLAHLSKDKNLCNAFNQGKDVHKTTAALIFGHDNPDNVSENERRAAKTINFGVMYGMSAFRLSNELGIRRKKAQEFITQYFVTYSGVQRYMNTIIDSARKKGYASTIMGRKRIISGISSSNKMVQAAAERVAINTPIQGSAADIVKKAMIAIDKALIEKFPRARLLLQVHDELIAECDSNEAQEVSKLIKDTMENIIALDVPLKVSVQSGTRWGEFH